MKRPATTIVRYLFCAILLVGWAGTAAAQNIPAPREVTGFPIGDDYKLADYDQMLRYFHLLDERSDRVTVSQYGVSAEGRPMILATITSPENQRRLEEYRSISLRLASGRATEEEAAALSEKGKAVVWIDSGLHATEIASAQHAFLLAYQLASRDDEEVRRILDNVIILLAPTVNPDGLDLVVHWYRDHQNLRIPRLYQKYIGHDNNRDFIMITQPETQAVSRILFKEWVPQIVYNHHQSAPRGTGIFVPEFRDPFNYNIDPLIIRGIHLVAAAMKMRFEEESKAGVISEISYSTWWNGGLRTASYFHNQIGILTETGIADPEPREVLPRPEQLKPTTNYPHPLTQRTWHLRDSVEYMLTGSWGVLDLAARYRGRFLQTMHQAAKRAVEAGQNGAPYAYVISLSQDDPATAIRLINTLLRAGIEVNRLREPAAFDGKTFAAGSYLIRTDQPFRPHLVDLMEPQQHPNDFQYPGGPPVPPYDIAGWTLPPQMHVDVHRAQLPLASDLGRKMEAVTAEQSTPAGSVEDGKAFAYAFSPAPNDSYGAAAELLSSGEEVFRLRKHSTLGGKDYAAGTFLVRSGAGTRGKLNDLASRRGLSFASVAEQPSAPVDLYSLHSPRIAIYEVYGGNIDAGWTSWIFEQFGIPYTTLWGKEIQAGHLRDKYDAIVFPSGVRIGTEPSRGRRRGGGPLPQGYEERIPMGKEGIEKLREFVQQGGTVVTMDSSAEMAMRDLGVPIRDVLQTKDREGRFRPIPRTEFYCPGSVLEAEFEPNHPIAFGMPPLGHVFFRQSPAFEVLPEGAETVSLAGNYPGRNPLESGWIWGESKLFGQGVAAQADMGKGHVILLGPQVQFRYQPHGTFKLLFNSVFLGASQPVQDFSEEAAAATQGSGR